MPPLRGLALLLHSAARSARRARKLARRTHSAIGSGLEIGDPRSRPLLMVAIDYMPTTLFCCSATSCCGKHTPALCSCSTVI